MVVPLPQFVPKGSTPQYTPVQQVSECTAQLLHPPSGGAETSGPGAHR